MAQATIYTAQSVPVVLMRLGPDPCQVTCPNCQQEIRSVVRPVSGLLTYLLVGGLCVFGCVFGCCLIPFCVDACKDVEHTCPNCNSYLGKYDKLRR